VNRSVHDGSDGKHRTAEVVRPDGPCQRGGRLAHRVRRDQVGKGTPRCQSHETTAEFAQMVAHERQPTGAGCGARPG
jgi:hypothetical protein